MKLFNTKITKEQSRDTGMAMVLLLLIAYWPRKRESLIAAAMAVHILNMTAPLLFRPVAVVWLGLSHAMGTVVSKVMLSLVFIVLVTPIAAFRRLQGKDALKLRVFKENTASAMQERNHTFVPQDMENPY